MTGGACFDAVANRLQREGLAIMAVSDVINPSALLVDAQCSALVLRHCRPDGGRCRGRDSEAVIGTGHDHDDVLGSGGAVFAGLEVGVSMIGTVPAGHHQPPRVRISSLCLMGLHRSTRQIAMPRPGQPHPEAKQGADEPEGDFPSRVNACFERIIVTLRAHSTPFQAPQDMDGGLLCSQRHMPRIPRRQRKTGRPCRPMAGLCVSRRCPFPAILEAFPAIRPIRIPRTRRRRPG